jgi:hypothetical protein
MSNSRVGHRRMFLPLVVGSVMLVMACQLSARPTLPAGANPTASPESVNAATGSTGTASLSLYADALAPDWNNWSWDPITTDLAKKSPVHSGSAAIAVTYTGAWSGFKLSRDTGAEMDISAYDTLRFWVNGGKGGQHITVQADGAGSSGDGVVITLTANAWTMQDLPLAQIGAPSTLLSVAWYNDTDGGQPTYYLDDISLLNSGRPTPTPLAPIAGPALSVNAAAGQHPINPDIYGLNFADPAFAAELDLPLNRWGGNGTTRYNWQLDISNHGSDWYFENFNQDNAHPENLPNGSAADQFVTQNRATHTDTILTMPLIGWTSKGPRGADPRNCGFPTSKYHNQNDTAPDAPCGDGKLSDTKFVTGNDPRDTSLPIDPTFDAAWVNHLVSQFGTAANGGVRLYDLDNEPSLWSDTHRDVHPQLVGYDEMYSRTVAYASAIKAADPSAQLLGPVEWGWTGYLYSGLDEAAGGDWYNHPPDRLNHGNVPFVEWYLQQMRAYEQAHGVRLVDYLDLHYYPQASSVALSAAGSAATQALRLRSTRSLWDPSYTDESWIATPVALIPLMKSWVAKDYPGTHLAMSEYNWGGLDHINGAVTEADVLGIFGREGLDLAALWDPPTAKQPGAYAFRLYLNYDGAHHKFGETSVQATSTDQEQLSVYAAQRGADKALTVMVINKSLNQAYTSSLALSGFSSAPAALAYRYSSANLSQIVHLPNQAVKNNSVTAVFPPQSMTLLVFSAAAP